MISDDMIKAGAEILKKRDSFLHQEAANKISRAVLDAAFAVVEPVENGELITTAKEWYDWSREWSGSASAFLNDEPDDEMTESECKAELYRGLCSLGNHMLWLEDKLRAIGPPAPSVAITNAFMRGANYIANNVMMLDSPNLVMNTAKAATEYALSAQVQEVAGWQSMDTAPKDGSEFAAGRRYSPDGEFVVHTYRWVGTPNYWNSKRNGVCIRPSYQDDYMWCPLPAAPAKQEN